MSTIHEQWIVYRDSCIPENASKSQLTALHSTFYAGELSMLTSLLELRGMTPDEQTEHFAILHKELTEFTKEHT